MLILHLVLDLAYMGLGINMATNTFIELQTVTFSTNTLSATFSSIPNTYKDLHILLSGSITDYNTLAVELNGSTSNLYRWNRVLGGTSGAGSAASGTYIRGVAGRFGIAQSATQINIFDYSDPDKHTTILSQGYSLGDLIGMYFVRWQSNDVVNSVTVRIDGQESFKAGTKISLFGIEA